MTPREDRLVEVTVPLTAWAGLLDLFDAHILPDIEEIAVESARAALICCNGVAAAHAIASEMTDIPDVAALADDLESVALRVRQIGGFSISDEEGCQ